LELVILIGLWSLLLFGLALVRVLVLVLVPWLQTAVHLPLPCLQNQTPQALHAGTVAGAGAVAVARGLLRLLVQGRG
jgi:hypothetical protein